MEVREEVKMYECPMKSAVKSRLGQVYILKKQGFQPHTSRKEVSRFLFLFVFHLDHSAAFGSSFEWMTDTCKNHVLHPHHQ